MESWLFNLDAKIARIVLKTKFFIQFILCARRRERESIVHFVKSFVFTIVNDTFERGRARDERFFEKAERGGWECRMGKNQLGEESRAKRTKLARTLRYVTVAIDVWEAVIIGSARREIIARERGQELVLVCTIRLYN